MCIHLCTCLHHTQVEKRYIAGLKTESLIGVPQVRCSGECCDGKCPMCGQFVRKMTEHLEKCHATRPSAFTLSGGRQRILDSFAL
ncbi:MAG TPA: hypothetical protein VFK07_00775 [Candidatus Paceibacterota bacterium]|nr:hypothetical protein [Candidatus Paceibacterota bacterium]